MDEDDVGKLGLRFIDSDDPDEVRSLQDTLARFHPGSLAMCQWLRADRLEGASARAYARDLTPERARAVIADLVWSFADRSPRGYFLSDQGKKLVGIGVEHPVLLPELVALLQTRPSVGEEISSVLQIVGQEQPEVGDLLLPLLADPQLADPRPAPCPRTPGAGGPGRRLRCSSPGSSRTRAAARRRCRRRS